MLPARDEVFCQLVLARIIEPTSKQDSMRVLEEVGVGSASYATLKRRLPGYTEEPRGHSKRPTEVTAGSHTSVRWVCSILCAATNGPPR